MAYIVFWSPLVHHGRGPWIDQGFGSGRSHPEGVALQGTWAGRSPIVDGNVEVHGKKLVPLNQLVDASFSHNVTDCNLQTATALV